ncbi:GntR family transcriptional regulator [Geobacter sulfurreducens]|jgi:DNA-binding GntR family transcriptional regulator|uniref:Helix-turn-helix transcriptional regulator, GntR family n=1 Tax=Geobacter sulfurreducens (strain ATCC 51573 / DSM 12127 / PCA) TaxID=243231 RepID=Q746Z7_GEOSL|nr:GntR family transcriptional regulator [Geobacter sulfurreducens]AAR36760.1 helix-turn-helix transcriptional regulator, GntR family [Geobacter sulfurreducens PCA]ADI86126.1 helix-turn-helix transcriptional regulator, GntR family [Geobacter sulfurreducens KN400]AJY69595.1 GntR family transcriptional regulator [Geobacter sulfurreducens]QVW35151.1 GntR family transcriptional regulator [Geobacter sulfurreducens]UAC04019.1 GntR family transcriptional regulator [Geobacter sulfurreducens]
MKKPMEKHLTLREKILETIRDAIMTGALKPGEKVAEPDLAERFGISRTPIREAFRQLESEGYLTVIPRKGAVVTFFSPRDVEEFYAIKSILEGYAARRACEKLTDKEIEKLRTINEKLRHLADEGDVRHFFRIHNDFHELFLRAADNEKLSELVTNLVRKFQRLRYASLSLPGRMHISVKEHERIIEAFQSRNADMAETLVRKNAEYGGRVLMQETDGAPPLKPAEQAAALQLDI